MKLTLKKTALGHALLGVVFIAVAGLLTSCSSTGGVRVKVKITSPAKKHEKVEIRVEEKKEAKAEAKAERKEAKAEAKAERKEAKAEAKAERKEAKVEEKAERKEAKVEAKAERKEAKVEKEKHGPPPHAPAHGYRHTHSDGTELVFDNSIGVYVVVDLSGTYFQDDVYIRSSKGQWEVSASLEGPWRRAAAKDVPAKLKAAGGNDQPAKERVSKRK